MPEYTIYSRGKNSKTGNRLFNGEPITAPDATSACTKAALKDKSLRISRLMAVPTPSPVKVVKAKDTVTARIITEGIEAMTSDEMVKLLKDSR